MFMFGPWQLAAVVPCTPVRTSNAEPRTSNLEHEPNVNTNREERR